MRLTQYVCLTVLAGAPALFGQATFTTLSSFSGTNGANPQCALTEIQPGVFLGTTAISSNRDAATLFRVSNTGVLNSVITFDINSQGGLPTGPLIPASNGNVWGVNQGGGPTQGGSIFRVDSTATVSIVTTEVNSPSAPVEASDYNLYFTNYTSTGTLTVARLSTSGALSTLYTFPKTAAQAGPLVQGSDGFLYGETQGIAPSYGTIYKLALDGSYSTLYTFTGGQDGAQPVGGLIQASNGQLYGVTNSGGPNGSGTLFTISSAGELTTLHTFAYFDGASPLSGLIQASDGYLYGANAGVGPYGGTIFRIAPDGSNYKTLYVFAASVFPQVGGAGLTQGSDGIIYGTTLLGGATNQGQVFSIDVGLPLPGPQIANFRPASASNGSFILLVGKNLSGTQGVSFNGTPANLFFSPNINYVVAQVPGGATTGPITVTTPNGSVQSAGTFIVN